ncbi:MAG: D-aminoacyl-tRNA deacylase [Lachnospiraceae bacterium]
MRFLIQRVKQASVTVDDDVIGAIETGYLLFVGVCETDTEQVADKLIKKVSGLRIFEDENGKTNLSINDVNGSLLIVSQFTLYADCRKGNRPSFINAGNPSHANALYEYIIHQFSTFYNFPVQTGAFGADMKISLINDGPFTIMLDSEEL